MSGVYIRGVCQGCMSEEYVRGVEEHAVISRSPELLDEVLPLLDDIDGDL